MTWMIKRSEDTLSHSAGHKYIDKYRDKNGNWQYVYDDGNEKSPVKNTIRDAYEGLRNAATGRNKLTNSVKNPAPTRIIPNISNSISTARASLRNRVERPTSNRTVMTKSGDRPLAKNPVGNTVDKLSSMFDRQAKNKQETKNIKELQKDPRYVEERRVREGRDRDVFKKDNKSSVINMLKEFKKKRGGKR